MVTRQNMPIFVGLNNIIMQIRIISVIAAALLLCSCGSAKRLAYLQDLQYETDTIGSAHYATIKPNDVLVIVVTSTKPELALPYNLYSVKSQMAVSTQRSSLSNSNYGDYARQETEGYLVDAEGNIDFPVLGRLHVGGMTRAELASMLKGTLTEFMPDPIVTVTFINFKVTVLGEVLRPGTYNVMLDKVTLLDALGMAGDMTVYGERSNILIIRENDGIRQTARLNIKSKDIFRSPFFYLQQNDVVVVEPINAKARSISPFVQNLPLFVSLGSLATSIAMVILNFSLR